MERGNTNERMAAFSTGNVSAFDEIYEAYADVVFHFTYALTKDEDLAQEITQQVFVKLWESRHKVGGVTAVRSYLLAMTRNHVLNHFRDESIRKRHVEEAAKHQAVDHHELHPEQPVQEQYLALAEKAIARLPPKRRRIFEMSRKQSLTYTQIADELGLSKTVVKKQMLLALRNIRDYLAGHTEVGIIMLIMLSVENTELLSMLMLC